MRSRSLLRLLPWLVSLVPFATDAAIVRTPHTEAELVAEHQHARPGEVAWVALRLKPDAGWHTYWRNSGDSGEPTRIRWTLPEGIVAGEIHWPYPELQRIGPVVNYGYSGETLHLVPITVPADWVSGRPLTLEAQAKWLVCSDICVPGEATLPLNLPVRDDTPKATAWAKAFAATRTRFPQPAERRGQLRVTEDKVLLTVDLPQLRGAREVQWFPEPNDLVAHAAPQQTDLQEGRLRLGQQRSDHYVAAPAVVNGVLVASHGTGERAYHLAADVSAAPPSPAQAAPSLALALLFAFIGGLILNLMPCVFPVLSIKAVSLLESRRESAASRRAHAMSYTAGVLATFVALAVVLVLLRRTGVAAGWGFHLQQPMFVTALAYFLFAMGLSLSGVAAFGTGWMGIGQSLAHRGGLRGSLVTGILAVVVASPCTAPFMGVAMGYALTQPTALTLLVFVALGLGLAFPMLLFGFVPAFARILPAPGAWMETFKQLMAFPLYLTAAWLLWVLGGLADRNAMALGLVGLTLLGFALWLWHRRGVMANIAKLAAVIGALALLWHPMMKSSVPSRDEIGSWSPERVSELRAAGRTVFVNFTADWCVTCLVNERTTLGSEAVRRAFESKDVVYLKGDWTRTDARITAELTRFGRSGVPLYLLYRNGTEAEVLPQLLTPDIVVNALEK